MQRPAPANRQAISDAHRDGTNTARLIRSLTRACRKDTTDSTIADLERLYPTAPDGPPDGANGRRSTYLHLLDCLLEFDAVRVLFGEATARRTLGAFPYYRWVYREVLERPEPIRQILRKYHLDAPDARHSG